LVLHPGAHLGQGEAAGLLQAARGLDEVLEATRKLEVRIALENTAGQGSCLGGPLVHLAELLEKVKRSERLGVCLDTCHFFAAGYDIRTPAGWDAAVGEADRLFGLDRVLAFHLNDSKGALGSHLDRHAHIGEGLLGKKAFAAVVNDPRFADCPGCLETPKSDDLHEDVKNLKTLKALRRTGSPGKETTRNHCARGKKAS
jgi:deoxyribonuclease-4